MISLSRRRFRTCCSSFMERMAILITWRRSVAIRILLSQGVYIQIIFRRHFKNSVKATCINGSVNLSRHCNNNQNTPLNHLLLLYAGPAGRVQIQP